MIDALLSSPQSVTTIKILGGVLLDAIWQCTLIGAMTWLALRSLREAAPQARYAVACIALLACVLWPVISLILAMAMSTGTSVGSAVIASTSVDDAMAIHAGIRKGATLSASMETALPWLVALWACGASLMLLRIATGLRWVARLRQVAQTAAPFDWQVRLDALALRFGLNGVRLAVFESNGGPLSAGIWRPIVLVPAALLARMPVDMIEALLAHELAHIRRHDYLVNLLQSASEALLFFHPVVWWLSRIIRRERENVADDIAATVLGEPRRLALALAELDRCILPPLTLAQAAHGGHLMSRIQSLLRPQHPTRTSAAVVPLTALVIACIGCFAYAKSTRDESMTAAPATAIASVKIGAVVASAPKHVSVIDEAHDTIALVERARDGIKMSGSSSDIDDINDAKTRVDGDFIWLRRNGQAFVVRDQQTIAKVRELWNTQSDTEKKMEALSAEMKLHSEKMEVISDRMDAATPDMHESPEMREAIVEIQALAHQQQGLAHQHEEIAIRAMKDKAKPGDKALAEALNGKMDALDQRMEALNSLVESEGEQMQARLAPLDALSTALEAAAKPIEAISSKMEALSGDYEREVQRMDEQVRSEIDRAVANGLAESVSASSRTPAKQ